MKYYKTACVASKSEARDDDGSTAVYHSVNKNIFSLRLKQLVVVALSDLQSNESVKVKVKVWTLATALLT